MIRAFQWDLARQAERLDWLLAQLPHYARWGYQELHLHLEDAVDYPSLPGVARRDAYSWPQFERLVATAAAHGIHVVPIVNLLGHTQYLIKTPQWRDLNELRAADGSALPVGQICPSHPGTLEAARRLVQDVAPLCTAGKIHFGLDESFLLGRHPASRATIEARGRAVYFADYVRQLHGLAQSEGLRCAIWADMLVLLPDAIPHLPAGLIAYDWYYHAFQRHPRFELHNFKEYDLVPALRAASVTHWGCALNGAFRYEPLPVFGERLANAQSWWRRCHETGAEGFLVTGWEPYRLAIETTTLVDAAIAGLWLDDGPHDQVSLLRRGWERVHGRRHASQRARQLLACDERAFAGYARWEVNQRWDTVHGREGANVFAAEVRFFARTLGQGPWPTVWAASLQWRLYLARRDVFVREASLVVLRGRRLRHRHRRKELVALAEHELTRIIAFRAQMQIAETAAQQMWLASRRAAQPNPNLEILRADRRRLERLIRWWTHVGTNPARIAQASVVAGRWMLRALVHTTRPNLQAVVVQICDHDDTWTDLHQRYLIEFRSSAAKPSTRIRHWLSVPLRDRTLRVRFALRGLGEFALGDVHLTDGVQEFRAVDASGQLARRVTLSDHEAEPDIFRVERTANRAVWEPAWAAAPRA